MIELINFTDLTLEEHKMVLVWRNHDNVKKWMFTDEDIILKNHLTFIESLKNCSNKLYFLVKQEERYLGVIDFTNIQQLSCEFGLYSNISLKGMGMKLLETICAYAFKELKATILKAKVFKENIKAIYLYKKFKFKEVAKKIVNKKEVICMELKRS